MSFESFQKARSKNIAEEIRLQKIVTSLEVEKKHWEKETFNQNYEDQRVAFMLKRDALDIKRRKELKNKKKSEVTERKPQKKEVKLPDISFLTNRLVGQNDANEQPKKQQIEKIEEKTEEKPTVVGKIPALKRSGGFSNISNDILKPKKVKPKPKPESLPDISLNDKVPQITVGDATNEAPALDNKEDSKSEGVPAGPVGKLKFANVVDKLLNTKKDDEALEGEEGQPQDEGGQDNQQGGATTDRSSRKISLISPPPKKVNLKKLVGRLFPQTMRRAKSLDQLEKLKGDGPKQDGPESKEVDGEESEGSREGESSENDPLDPVIIVNDYWVGDPKAIGSVRRQRQPPEIMTARHKNVGEVMKLIRDLPMYPSCSRNCNRPGAIFDSMVASSPHTLLPSMAKANVARHYKKKSKMAKAISQVNHAVQAVAAFNRPSPLPPIQDATVAAASTQKKIQKDFQQRQQSLRKTTRELRRNLKRATERLTFKPTQKVVSDGRGGTRVQLSYTFDPVSRLRTQQGVPASAK